eukprot:10221897-Ditylum_brightwellii.AAC.1
MSEKVIVYDDPGKASFPDTPGVLPYVIYTSLFVLIANKITKMVSRSKNKPSREKKWHHKRRV